MRARLYAYNHHVPEHRLNRIVWLYAVTIQIWINSIPYFTFKILTLARIWTRDLLKTKPICYQLSYPDLDRINYLNIQQKLILDIKRSSPTIRIAGIRCTVKGLPFKFRTCPDIKCQFMLTLESRCIPEVLGGVLILRTLPNP